MQYNLQNFEKEVENGYLRKNEDEFLVQYTYTESCESDRYWTPITRAARGIIFEKSTGKLVAKPFEKFFNLGSQEETFLYNLPKEPYTAYEKYDGSLGIIFYYNNEWRVATKGSLKSEQAQKAQELLYKYNLNSVPYKTTLLVEIIYPENKIVVNYGKEEKLVLLGAFDIETSKELPPESVGMLSKLTEIPLANVYNYTIEQMIELQKTLPKDQEGFVVRFDNGFRVKIKGDEYCRIHKIISHLSPLSLWEVMNTEGKVDSFYIQQIPEEYREEFEPIVSRLENQYYQVNEEVFNDIMKLPNYPDLTDKRVIGIFVHSENNGLKHSKAIFPYITNKQALHKYIMNQIRPTGNNFKDV